jgi:hypothetical protein
MKILGIDYMLKDNCKISDYKALEEREAYTDFTTKEIIVSEFGEDYNSVKNIKNHINKVKRHEIIHAMLYESGLDCNSDWATNEEIVDWVAIQYPKLKSIYEKLNIEE